MKLLVVCVLAIIAAVASEPCTTIADCSHTLCAPDNVLICALDLCTCTEDIGESCTHTNECHNPCNGHGHGHGHCVNGQCVCH